jgi:methionine synthase I (cobalamin-dependent)
MSRFLHALRCGRVLLMDGAMGTQLLQRGLSDNACFELCNLEHPDWVEAIHQAYVRAGAECLLTHTFQANSLALARHQLAGNLETIAARAYSLARAAAGPDQFVIADIGPIFDTATKREFPDRATVRQITHCLRGADAVLLETCSSPRVRHAARWASCGLPLLLSLTYRVDKRLGLCTQSGHPPEWFAERAADWGVTALGVNCGRDIDMAETIEIVRRYRRATDLPLFARPNAGTPTRQNGQWVYPRSPESMAKRLPELLEADVAMVGGCCGTTPEHIAVFHSVVEAWNATRDQRSRAGSG